MNRVALYFFFFLVASFILPSCIKEEIRLSRSHRKIVDSLTQARTVGIREELDSLCDIRFAEEIDRATDSIVQDRLSEIQRKIEQDARAKKN